MGVTSQDVTPATIAADVAEVEADAQKLSDDATALVNSPPPPPPAPTPAPTPAPASTAMPRPDIAVINESSVLTDDQVAAAVVDLQTQISRDFAPFWGIDATLHVVAKGTPLDPAWWVLGIFDTSDQAGALGYHDITSTGQPLGKVFAKSDLNYGTSWTVTLSHECLEMLGDPGICSTIMLQNNQGQVEVLAYEACDACEADRYAYTVGQTLLSDFVYPAWFTQIPGAQFDHGNHISHVLGLLPGGYIGVWTPTSGWTQRQEQDTADAAPGRMRAQVGSRRERRRVGRGVWLFSTAV